MAPERVLIVDDEPGVRSMLEAILGDEGYAVESAGTGEAGVAAALARPFDAVLLDVWLPGIDGLQTLASLRDRGVGAEVVMISGHGTIETAVKATKLGAFDFVEKPLSLEKTLLVLRNALRQRRLEQRNRLLLERLTQDTEILGSSAPAQRLRREVETAAGSEAPVLVCGEPGTGRETAARRIHASSRRADGPLVHVPCAVLEGPQAGHTLFGSEAEPAGRLALAERGSLLLEEIDQLPAALQSRLEGWLSGRPDVRVLATAATDPSGLRSPLREHVDVVRIATAPLRERREDIAYLANRFMQDLAREYGRDAKVFTPEALTAMVRHDWPGNVRALRNAVERILVLSVSPEVRVEDLPPECGGSASIAVDLYAPFPTLAEGVAAFERFYLLRALNDAKGDLESAARRAGLSPDVMAARLRGAG